MTMGTRVLDNGVFVHGLEQVATFDFSEGPHPMLMAISEGKPTVLDPVSGHYVIIFSGEFRVTLDGQTHSLRKEWFGSFPGAARIQGEGRALIFSSIGYRCATLISGPAEEFGRLRHIDGSTSSPLLLPAVSGEPSLNLLHLPRGTFRTMRARPSLRAGLVLSGHGRCETPDGLLGLRPGTAFFIPPDVRHSFQSREEALRIALYQPN